MEKKMFVGEYLPNDQDKFFEPDQKFLAIDNASGGYPYRVTIDQARYWKTQEELQHYLDIVKSGIVIKTVTFTVE